MEPGRDEQRFPASQKNDWKSGQPLPAKWETVSHPKINKAVVVLSTHTTDTILAGGGFSDATQIESPNPDTDTSHLEAVTKVFLQ